MIIMKNTNLSTKKRRNHLILIRIAMDILGGLNFHDFKSVRTLEATVRDSDMRPYGYDGIVSSNIGKKPAYVFFSVSVEEFEYFTDDCK